MPKGTKIIDCFTFYNEIDMLKLRLKLMYPVVDYFVICEATRTFRGNIKPLYYASNKHLFAEYADKIVHLVDDELTELAQNDNDKTWENEAHQRGYMWKGVESLLEKGLVSDEDYVVVSDLDEIPNPESLAGLGPDGLLHGEFYTLAMDMYYYSLEYKCTEVWSLPKVIRCRELRTVFMKDMNWVRRTFSPNVIADAGWHLSYFGDVSFIQNKLANFGHQEYNTPEYTSADAIRSRIQNCEDLFGRDGVKFEYIQPNINNRLHPVIMDLYYTTSHNKYPTQPSAREGMAVVKDHRLFASGCLEDHRFFAPGFVNSSGLVKLKEGSYKGTVDSQENYCHYVCSRGILKSCDIHELTPQSSSNSIYGRVSDLCINATKPFSVYVCSSAVDSFVTKVVPKITQPFVLVSGDSDDSMPFDALSPEGLFSFCQNPLLIRWYSQNCVVSDKRPTNREGMVFDNPKLVQMPIGLDYHTLAGQSHRWGPKATPVEQEQELMSINKPPTESRIIKAYCNFQFMIHGGHLGHHRHDAIHQFPAHLTFYEPHHTTRAHAWNEQAKYAFVLSPHGNGLDCHRTWEALCLGCIPIVKKSPLDPMYAGLPVLVLDEWSDASEELLRDKLRELAPLFDSPEFKAKMSLKYWVERIQSDVNSAVHNNMSVSGIWDARDKTNYEHHVKTGAGQIHGDAFAADIEALAADPNNHTFLEIGTWNGLGSTMAFSRGFKSRPSAQDDYIFYSLECNADKCRDAQKLHAGNPNIHILNEVVWNEEPVNFYEVFPQCKTDAMYKHWNDVDLANMKKCPVFLDRPDLPQVFDVLLLDGGEFTTYFEFQLLKNRCRLLLLDDTNVDKCKLIVEELRADPQWEIVKEVNVRNGYLIARRLN